MYTKEQAHRIAELEAERSKAIVRLSEQTMECGRLDAKIEQLTATRAHIADLLSNLLARIHRDGGHYEGTHGTEKACSAADEMIVILTQAREERDTLRTQLGQALDEVERLQPWAHSWLSDTYEHMEGEAERIINDRSAPVAAMLRERKGATT